MSTKSFKRTSVLIAIFLIFALLKPVSIYSQASASTNYSTQTGNLGTSYSWINCSSGTSIITGDDTQASVTWPFSFSFYNNNYTTANSLSVATNGFIRLDGVAAGSNYSGSSSYDLTASATGFGQIISMSMYDCYVGRTASSWIKYLVTGTAPYRVLTIEYNNIEVPYYAGLYANVQVSFYESLNKVVLKFGTDNTNVSGVDIGIHSGVNGYFNKWQEVLSGTNNTWIEYTPPVKVLATQGTSLAYYTTLKAAFDKINSGTHQGDITIQIQENTVETASAVLNASGTGSANYASVNVFPTASGKSITGNLATPLIDLNGADNVTIDGRVNGIGTTKDLIIANSSTSSVAGTSTIRLINDATNNIIKYSTIKGSQTLASSGIIYFATSTGITGNDGNSISNNNITNSLNANRPVNAIYSSGTTGKENSNNSIANNNIYDFLKYSTSSNGIFISSNSTNFNIIANSFYETTSFVSSGTVAYNAIQIDNITGDGFTVSDNYFGGSSASCGGTAWTKTNAANNVFNAILLSISTTNASSVQNNTIRNFNWSNSSNAAWTGINIANGTVNLGTVTGNTIGSNTGNGSITVTGATNGQNIYGIYISTSGIVDCKNNTIGSITSANGATFSSNIFGIYKSASAGTITVSNNSIGSNSTSNSINASSSSTSNPQTINGICSLGTGTTIISDNTIANLNNSATGVSNSSTCGILTSSGSNAIQNNTIYNISSSSAQSGTGTSASAVGIMQKSKIAATSQSVNGNVVYNISNTNSSARVDVYGIYYAGPSAGINIIIGNFIHDLSISSSNTSSDMDGIVLNDGLTTCANNIITLGNNLTNGYKINGIWDNSGATNNNSIYFNTVYIGGTVTGTTSSTSALWNAANTSTRNYRNNVFVNARSGGSTGTHYAIRLAGTTTLTIDYNDYFVSGTGGVLAYLGSNQSTLANLQTATGQDANSLANNPLFTNAGGLNVADYYTAASLVGVDGTGVTTGFYGITRNIPPKMGALESNSYIWQGATSTNFATATNWLNGTVPPNGADITFAANPSNHCVLDQDRILRNIYNAQGTDELVVNGKQLTITGNLIFSNGAQINANSASSVIIFEGTEPQAIPTGAFVSNTIEALTLNNAHGLTQNGNIIITSNYSLTTGDYNIGANTLTINGAISITNGNLTGGSTSNITIGGSGASTNLPEVIVNNLILNRSNGINLAGNLSVGGALTLTSGTISVGANILTINGSSPTRTSGNINASNAGATLAFNNSSAITLAASIITSSINNLTISGAGGITSVDDLTVTGILNLSAQNPTATKGTLDMLNGATIKTLNMGANASTIGQGEVSGIIKRTTINSSVLYTFGSQYTTAYFTTDGTIPTEISAKITFGSTPSWRSGAINREIEIIQTGGSGTKAMFTCHYLDSELNGNDENRLAFWTKYLSFEYGRSGINTQENWVSLSNVNVAFFPSSFDAAKILTLDEFSTVATITWNGSVSDSWTSVENWTPNSGPSAEKNIIIPNSATTPNSPTLPALTEIKTLTIEPNGIINAVAGAQLTINGGNGAWINNGGTLNPNTSTVIFSNASPTLTGATSFYDVTINTGTTLMLLYASTMRIAGAVTNNGVWRTVIGGNSTVEYNGGNQTVVVPNASTNRYYNLILSGTGTKTLPSSALNIVGSFSIMDDVTTTGAAALTIGGNLHIDDGATFSTGAFDHSLAGNFHNDGTFSESASHSITFNGTVKQTILGNSETTFEKLIINNTAGVDLYQNAIINNLLTLTNGNLSVGETSLTINGDIVKTGGFLVVDSLSSIIFGGTTALTLPNALFESSPSLNNLTINRAGGVIASSDFTVFGILNLQSANPVSGTIGSLDMGTNTLNMGEDATTIGLGDVTGIVRRASFLPNTAYTFGNQFTSITFTDGGTLPEEISLKINIGTAPFYKVDAIKRSYDIVRTGGDNTKISLKLHYLDSELQANLESELVTWDYHVDEAGLVEEHGVSNSNNTDEWISISNRNLTYLPTVFDNHLWTLSKSITPKFTWQGTPSTDWNDANNWAGGTIPISTSNVIIPDASTTLHDPELSASATVKTIIINDGGILDGGTGTILTITGSTGAWLNLGTFNAGTNTVIFTNANATMADPTNFYNVTIATGASLTPEADNFMRIAGTFTNNGILRAALIPNTIEFNGTGDQIIINPNGITPGYYNLIISGSGTKTMSPLSATTVHGDFTITGTATAVLSDSVIVFGNTSVENGATLNINNKTQMLYGNFENDGTLTATTGGNMVFRGTAQQSISGSSTTNFDILTINNLNGVTQSSPVNVTNNLLLSNGDLIVGNTTLGLNGTITSPGGQIQVSSSTNISFGGADAITLNNNLFSGNPSINDLTINRSGGVALANQGIAVNGTLNLTSGTLTIGENTLTIAGNSPVRTSGNINASNVAATLEFANATAITLPASIFTGNVNNLTLSGIGGITAVENISLNSVLNLQAANPSSTKGILDMGSYTLNMGENATTTGIGDLTGIVRRQHTFTDGVEYSFGNQFTTIDFLGIASSSKPTWLSCKISIGSVPTWRGEAVKRYYSFAQSGGTDRVIAKLHYLDSELHDAETDESQLVYWDAYDPAFTPNNFVKLYPRSSNNYNDSENWIQLIGPAINYLATSSTLDVKQWSFSYSTVTEHIWTGNGSPSYDGDWSLPGNWNGGVPTAQDKVVIPDPANLPTDNNGDLAPYCNLLSSITSCVAKTVEIKSNATLNASAYDITVYGNGDAWVNNGTFTPGEKTVYFANGIISEEMHISGSTQFYNLNITDKTNVIPQSACEILISGDLTCDGTISDANVNTITFNSAVANQNLIGRGTVNIYNLTMNNTFATGVLNLLMPINISNILTLTSNNIVCDDVNFISMGTASTVSPTEGIATSYVEGPMAKMGDAAFTFPIGSASVWAPIGIEAPASSSTISATYNAGGGPYNWSTAYMCSGSDIVYTSGVENWELTTTDATPGVTLYWKTTESGIVEPSEIVVAHYNGSCWENMGGTATGDATSGFITSTVSFTSYSPIAFGTKTKANPLPVSLLYFDINCNNKTTLLQWATASEINNNYFEIEKSLDAINWEYVEQILGSGNTNSVLNYKFEVINTDNSLVYYRLKQVDYDGKQSIIALKYADCSSILQSKITLMPNPASQFVKIVSDTELFNEPYTLTNAMGQIVMKGFANNYETEINIESLKPGLYHLTLPGKKDSFKLSKF